MFSRMFAVNILLAVVAVFLGMKTYGIWFPKAEKLLQDGINPGLGIRALHEQGINGSNVGIAIIDQPLLLGHKEYSSRITRYDATSLVGIPLID